MIAWYLCNYYAISSVWNKWLSGHPDTKKKVNGQPHFRLGVVRGHSMYFFSIKSCWHLRKMLDKLFFLFLTLWPSLFFSPSIADAQMRRRTAQEPDHAGPAWVLSARAGAQLSPLHRPPHAAHHQSQSPRERREHEEHDQEGLKRIAEQHPVERNVMIGKGCTQPPENNYRPMGQHEWL